LTKSSYFYRECIYKNTERWGGKYRARVKEVEEGKDAKKKEVAGDEQVQSRTWQDMTTSVIDGGHSGWCEMA
jgi:hypothetical protein